MTKASHNTPQSKLLSSTSALTFSKGRVNSGADHSSGWHAVKVGPRGREAYVAQYKYVRPGETFSNLTIELGYEFGDTMIGIIRLPLGLKRTSGIRLQVDEAPATPKLPFSGFNGNGGIVAVSLTSDTVAALRTGSTLRILSQAASNGIPINFVIPLAGFAAAGDQLRRILAGGAS